MANILAQNGKVEKSVINDHVSLNDTFQEGRGSDAECISRQDDGVALIKIRLLDSIAKYHKNNAEFIYWLAIYDQRRLYLDDAYSSTYDFLTRGHGLSEGSAWRRVKVARLMAEHPQVLSSVEVGEISMTILALLVEAKLSADDLSQGINDLKRKSKRDAERWIALRKNVSDAQAKRPERVKIVGSRKFPPTPVCQSSPVASISQGSEVGVEKESTETFAACGNSSMENLWGSPGLDLRHEDQTGRSESEGPKELIYGVRIQLDENTLDQLRAAKDDFNCKDLAGTIASLLDFYKSKSKKFKTGSTDKLTVATTASQVKIDQNDAKQYGVLLKEGEGAEVPTARDLPSRQITSEPGTMANVIETGHPRAAFQRQLKTKKLGNATGGGPFRSRYIPAAVRRVVWQKYQGQCGYVCGDTGVRCSAKRKLEFEHIRPFAKGGSHDVENLMILCKSHNLRAAEIHFGPLR
jgi:5-methylcytosine-specific restriction endonuclease McrA